MRTRTLFAALAFAAATPLAAAPFVASQDAGLPGTADVSRVVAGTYDLDSGHSYAHWTVNHMGFTPLDGMFGNATGTLTIDPESPEDASVDVTFDMTGFTTHTEAFTNHLKSEDFFNVAEFPTARFVSTAVEVDGTTAEVTGDLTIHGVTKSVTLDTEFFGAGANPMNKKLNIGFTGTTTIKRSDFGLGYAVPVVTDEVELKIVAAFVKQ
ncbi:YceI family protein [Stakelama tenebrarum]|uniref:Polyisoprenoid-binding protein n=1 Tax=Stakelama tenebrarum TaxID=2711215 RepID=A0A6G6Y8V3_9SPHN|nr:YceI family protein [Sphingosinithalassobacter tenebrarum]QIG81003.1 polyisoprenoid-binding protein [Sphingosinithalassobacter tenebrarum]